jgi:hypothetical protein
MEIYHALSNDPNSVTSCPLDNCMFSAGNLRDEMQTQFLIRKLSERNDKAVMVHANWLSGKENKKHALHGVQLWIARRVGNPIGGFEPRNKIKPVVGNWTCVEPAGRVFAAGNNVLLCQNLFFAVKIKTNLHSLLYYLSVDG